MIKVLLANGNDIDIDAKVIQFTPSGDAQLYKGYYDASNKYVAEFKAGTFSGYVMLKQEDKE